MINSGLTYVLPGRQTVYIVEELHGNVLFWRDMNRSHFWKSSRGHRQAWAEGYLVDKAQQALPYYYEVVDGAPAVLSPMSGASVDVKDFLRCGVRSIEMKLNEG